MEKEFCVLLAYYLFNLFMADLITEGYVLVSLSLPMMVMGHTNQDRSVFWTTTKNLCGNHPHLKSALRVVEGYVCVEDSQSRSSVHCRVVQIVWSGPSYWHRWRRGQCPQTRLRSQAQPCIGLNSYFDCLKRRLWVEGAPEKD